MLGEAKYINSPVMLGEAKYINSPVMLGEAKYIKLSIILTMTYRRFFLFLRTFCKGTEFPGEEPGEDVAGGGVVGRGEPRSISCSGISPSSCASGASPPSRLSFMPEINEGSLYTHRSMLNGGIPPLFGVTVHFNDSSLKLTCLFVGEGVRILLVASLGLTVGLVIVREDSD